MASQKKVLMNHSLAKALIEAGMEHFDGGGVISAGNSNPLAGISGALTVQNSYNANGPNMDEVVQNQNALAGQLRNEASGGGPNPAQIQYQQNAQQIAQQQAAMNAQNRALNPALAARMSGNAAVESGQQAAGGAAAQQAQQQIASQQQLAQLYGQQQNTALGAEGLNAQVSQNNANSVNQTEGGILNSIGGALKMIPGVGGIFGAFKGGEVPDHLMKIANIYHAKKYAVGGSVNVPGLPNFSNAATLQAQQDQKNNKQGPGQIPAASQGPLSATTANNFGASTLSLPELGSSEGVGAAAGAPSLLADLGPAAALAMKSGGRVPALVSPGEAYLSPKGKAYALVHHVNPLSVATKIPGDASTQGDSYKNDTVPAYLESGGVVFPRHVTMSSNAPSKAAEFLKHIQEKNGKKDDPQTGFSKVAAARRNSKSRKRA